jgi:Holliday junction resolvasome RuvABC endonuclease subunit
MAFDLPPGGILALDLSSVTGFAVGGVYDNAPRFGTWHLPKSGGEGARYAAFENELIEAVERYQPGRIVLEAPMSFQAMLGVSTMKVMAQQLTLRGMAYAEGWRNSIPVSEVSADMVRLAILGQQRFAKGTVKAAVVAYCRSIGLRVPDHNAGDAVLLWLYQVGQLRGGLPAAGPLFRERRILQ